MISGEYLHRKGILEQSSSIGAVGAAGVTYTIGAGDPTNTMANITDSN